MRILATIFALAVACGVTVALAGCNTTKGVGQDMQDAGNGISNAAERNGAH